MKTALIIGSTGLVGSHLAKQLSNSKHYSKIILLNRRASGISLPNTEEHIIDFDKPDLKNIQAEDVFCCIGTTLKKAGSKAAQYKIDCEYPSVLASLLKAQGTQQFILVSSIGASAHSGNFYLRTKGELENNIKNLNFSSFIVVRPSFILGNRKEFRAGEKFGILLMKVLGPLMLGRLKKYRGVNASAIASSMNHQANSNNKGYLLVESDQIQT